MVENQVMPCHNTVNWNDNSNTDALYEILLSNPMSLSEGARPEAQDHGTSATNNEKAGTD